MAVCWLGWWWDADCLGHRGGCVSSGCVVSVEVSEEGSVGGWLVGELAWRIPKGGRTWSARGRVAPRLSYARQSDRRARGESRASPTIRPCMLPPHGRGAAVSAPWTVLRTVLRTRRSRTRSRRQAGKNQVLGLPPAASFFGANSSETAFRDSRNASTPPRWKPPKRFTSSPDGRTIIVLG